MNRAEIRTRRLFDQESGWSCMTAFDHGLVTRVPDAVDALGIVEKAIAGGPVSVLVSPGMLERSGHLFAFRGLPLPSSGRTSCSWTRAWKSSGTSTGSCLQRRTQWV
jgi:DhnA family fructose-bisphosphate aldolase class Ia